MLLVLLLRLLLPLLVQLLRLVPQLLLLAHLKPVVHSL